MSEIKDIGDLELDKVLELVDFGKMDILESCINEPHDMLEELLGIVLTQGDDIMNMQQWHQVMGGVVNSIGQKDSCQGPSPFLTYGCGDSINR